MPELIDNVRFAWGAGFVTAIDPFALSFIETSCALQPEYRTSVTLA